MDAKTLKEKDKLYIANTYARFDILIEEGKGSELKGEGREFIDFGGGIAVNTFGNADIEWAEAVYNQLKTLSHTSNLYYTEPCIAFAQTLCERTGFEKVFFSNSGAEANECAIKAARKYSSDKYGDNRYDIVTLKDSFHGRTMATLTATGQEDFHKYFNPFLEGFVYAKPTLESVVDVITDNTCAIIIELVQGEGGVNVLDKELVAAISKVCEEKDILLIVDEVQTGNGRTGSLYAYMQYGIMPDIITTAKGLGGGLPIGATMFGKKVANVLTSGSHGSTFGANPAIAKGALNILNRLDDNLLCAVVKKGEFIRNYLLALPKVKAVSGMGLMIGVEIEGDAKEAVKQSLEKGLLILSAKHKLRLLPPLNISEELLLQGLNILKEVLE